MMLVHSGVVDGKVSRHKGVWKGLGSFIRGGTVVPMDGPAHLAGKARQELGVREEVKITTLTRESRAVSSPVCPDLPLRGISR